MNDSYFAQASAQAKKAADEYKSTFDSTLSDLLNISNLQKQQVTNNYNNLLNQINANRASLQEQYKTNARQSYVNKLLADQQTTDTLSRMNLNQSGFRLTQDTLANNQYDASLNQLAMAQDAGLRDLDTQGLNALNTYNNDLLKLDLDYNNKLAALKQQIADNVNNYYNKEYDRFYNDLKYQDQLKQQALENQMKQQQLNVSIRNSYSGGGSSKSSTSSSSSSSSKGTIFSDGSTGNQSSVGNFGPSASNGNTNSGETITLQGTYSPRLSSNANQQWFNNLTNSISKQGYKMTYNDLISEMEKANLTQADAEAVFKAFGITDKGIVNPTVKTINNKSTNTNTKASTNTNKSILDSLSSSAKIAGTVAKYANPLNLITDVTTLPIKLLSGILK